MGVGAGFRICGGAFARGGIAARSSSELPAGRVLCDASAAPPRTTPSNIGPRTARRVTSRAAERAFELSRPPARGDSLPRSHWPRGRRGAAVFVCVSRLLNSAHR